MENLPLYVVCRKLGCEKDEGIFGRWSWAYLQLPQEVLVLGFFEDDDRVGMLNLKVNCRYRRIINKSSLAAIYISVSLPVNPIVNV